MACLCPKPAEFMGAGQPSPHAELVEHAVVRCPGITDSQSSGPSE